MYFKPLMPLLLGIAWCLPAAAAVGDHVRVGQAELVPSIQVGGEWRSNVYLEETDPVSGASLVFQPGLKVGATGGDVEFSLAGRYLLRKYLDPELAALDRFYDNDWRARIDLLPRSVVGFRVDEAFQVETRPVEETSLDRALITHLTSATAGWLTIHPGSALEGDLGGNLGYDSYNVPDGVTLTGVRYNARLAGGPAAELRWAFFPKTAVVLDGRLDFYNWRDNVVYVSTDDACTVDCYYGLPDGMGFQLRGGIAGNLSETVLVDLRLGYGSIYYDETSVTDQAAADGISGSADLDPATAGFDQDLTGLLGLLARAQVTWTPRVGHRIDAAYEKSFSDSWFTNFMAYNTFMGRYSLEIASRVETRVEGTWRLEQYRGATDRTDSLVKALGGVDYVSTGWLRAGAYVSWRQRSPVGDSDPTVAYKDLLVGLRAVATY